MPDVAQLVADTATAYGVDPQLALELAAQESRLNQGARSGAGAIGVMQLMPSTAADLGVDPYDLYENIDGGVRYLGQMLSAFGGDVVAALAAYNWGPGNVDRAIASHGEDWLAHTPAETQNHVARILASLATEYTAEVTLPLPRNGSLPLPPPAGDWLDGALALQAMLLFFAVLLGTRLVLR